MENKIPKELLDVYKEFDNCKRCRNEGNTLLHILGGGKFKNPQFLFLFINPTHLNFSSHKDYKGERRYPFIGVRYFYRLLSEAGFLDKKIVEDIYKRGWQIEDEHGIEQGLAASGIYMTNLVKCTNYHPQNPARRIIKEDFPLLQKEIDIVSPKYIVAFGTLVFRILTNKNIRLADAFRRLKQDDYNIFQSIDILGRKYNVLPCYFPIGRGSPQKALEMLRYIKEKYYKR